MSENKSLSYISLSGKAIIGIIGGLILLITMFFSWVGKASSESAEKKWFRTRIKEISTASFDSITHRFERDSLQNSDIMLLANKLKFMSSNDYELQQISRINKEYPKSEDEYLMINSRKDSCFVLFDNKNKIFMIIFNGLPVVGSVSK